MMTYMKQNKSPKQTLKSAQNGLEISFKSLYYTCQYQYCVVDMSENREFKHNVYGRWQMAKIISDFLFFSCTKVSLTIPCNANILILLYRGLKTDDKSFIFAVNAVCQKCHA